MAAKSDDRSIVRKLAEKLGTKQEDLPKTLERFKKEIAEMKASLA
jgi:hypothetical protein